MKILPYPGQYTQAAYTIRTIREYCFMLPEPFALPGYLTGGCGSNRLINDFPKNPYRSHPDTMQYNAPVSSHIFSFLPPRLLP